MVCLPNVIAAPTLENFKLLVGSGILRLTDFNCTKEPPSTDVLSLFTVRYKYVGNRMVYMWFFYDDLGYLGMNRY